MPSNDPVPPAAHGPSHQHPRADRHRDGEDPSGGMWTAVSFARRGRRRPARQPPPTPGTLTEAPGGCRPLGRSSRPGRAIGWPGRPADGARRSPGWPRPECRRCRATRPPPVPSAAHPTRGRAAGSPWHLCYSPWRLVAIGVLVVAPGGELGRRFGDTPPPPKPPPRLRRSREPGAGRHLCTGGKRGWWTWRVRRAPVARRGIRAARQRAAHRGPHLAGAGTSYSGIVHGHRREPAGTLRKGTVVTITCVQH